MDWVVKKDDRVRKKVAKIIPFYIPANFQRRVKWTPPLEKGAGAVIEFPVNVKKPA